MKYEARSTKFETNSKQEAPNSKQGTKYDLEERTLQFAKDVRVFVRKFPKDSVTNEDVRQITRSSGSVGANYLEANESLSKKDFLMRIKISKKEARETLYWLELLLETEELRAEKSRLMKEVTELIYILGAILRNSKE